MKTITDAGRITGLKRRAIQEYEKAGIAIKPTKKNKYGYNVYDDAVMDRLWQIRFYRELGFKTKDMKDVFDNENYDYTATLNSQIELLKKKKEEIDNLISVATMMLDMGMKPKILRSSYLGFDPETFDDSFSLFSALAKVFSATSDKDISDDEYPITDDQLNQLEVALDYVIDCFLQGKTPDDSSTQETIKSLHQMLMPILSDSCTVFGMMAMILAPGSSLADDFDEIYKNGAADFIYQAIKLYCTNELENGSDKELLDAIEAILALGKQHYAANSDEVQAHVKAIYSFYSKMVPVFNIEPIQFMESAAILYSDPGYYTLFDKQVRGRGAGKYIARAIKVFINGQGGTK